MKAPLNVLIAIALGSCVAVASAQQAHPVTCTAINQVFLQDPRGPMYFFLDIPAGATFVSAEYQARAASGGPWMKCGDANPPPKATVSQQQLFQSTPRANQSQPTSATDFAFFSSVTACQTLLFTDYSQLDNADKTPHYFIRVDGIAPTGFFGEVYVRMVVTYEMKGPSCVIQQSYWADKGTAVVQLADLRILPGKTIIHEHTFGRIDPPGPPQSNWLDCGSDQGSFPGGTSTYTQCLQPIAVGMYTRPIPNDGVDAAPGRMSACGANGWGGAGWCRISLEYMP